MSNTIKLLIDEDLSPAVARYLCQQCLADAIAVRDRGLLGASDREVLAYAIENDRILVTANIKDFENFAVECEVHPGIVFLEDGEMTRREQEQVMEEVIIPVLQEEIEQGNDLINRALYLTKDKMVRWVDLP